MLALSVTVFNHSQNVHDLDLDLDLWNVPN